MYSGIQYLRARYYEPETGRFLTRDSYLGNVMSPLTLNRYDYTGNNPLMYIDPSGHSYKAGAYGTDSQEEQSDSVQYQKDTILKQDGYDVPDSSNNSWSDGGVQNNPNNYGSSIQDKIDARTGSTDNEVCGGGSLRADNPNTTYPDLYKNGKYDRDAAVAYATNPNYTSPDKNAPLFGIQLPDQLSFLDVNKHTRNYNPDYERYDSYGYYLLGHLSGSDCANFISQALFSGGVKQTDGFYFKWDTL